MNPNTKKMVSKILEGRHFNKCLDLGCGEGYYSDVLKKHCNYLIGVDHNLSRLSVARKFGGYNEVHFCEVQDYNIPRDVDAVFMFDLIEHLPKKDGFDLLLKVRHVPFVLLTTPAEFHKLAFRNHHQSLWTEQELRENGFKTIRYSLGILQLFRDEVIAWRDSG